MKNILEHKGFAFGVISIAAIFLTLFYSIPLSQKTGKLLKVVEPVFDEATPIIYLTSGGLEFEGSVPYQLELENGVHVLFLNEGDSTLLDSLPAFSMLFTNDAIIYKTREETKSISLENIETDRDRIELHPVKIGQFLIKFSAVLMLITGLLILISFMAALYLVALTATGMGIMVDAFSDGPYSFQVLFRAASIFLFVLVLLWMLLGFSTLQQLKFMLLFFIVVFVALVYMTIRFSRRA